MLTPNPHLRCRCLNPLYAELNPICHLLALVGARHIVHVSRLRVKQGTAILLPILRALVAYTGRTLSTVELYIIKQITNSLIVSMDGYTPGLPEIFKTKKKESKICNSHRNMKLEQSVLWMKMNTILQSKCRRHHASFLRKIKFNEDIITTFFIRC